MPPKPGKAHDAKKYVQTTLFQAFKHPKNHSSLVKDSSMHEQATGGVGAEASSSKSTGIGAQHQSSKYFESANASLGAPPLAPTSPFYVAAQQSNNNTMEIDNTSKQAPPVAPTQSTNVTQPPPQSQPLTQASSFTSNHKSNDRYAAVAAENIEIFNFLLPTIFPSVNIRGKLYDACKIGHIGRSYCPKFTLPAGDSQAGQRGCRIRVVNGDSFDVACEMMDRAAQAKGTSGTGDELPPVVLNLANQYVRGGGWRKGAMAQEEELCYRSTLYATLDKKHYPMADTGAIYSRHVAIFRTRSIHGHKLYPMAEYICNIQDPNFSGQPPSTSLPVVSTISVAAIRDPKIEPWSDPPKYLDSGDREIMKTKIRLVLRMAAKTGHRKIVLGALGCGAFNNPKQEVANMFMEIFTEYEFTGGWWEEVAFAVLDTSWSPEQQGENGTGNYGVFYRTLHGKIV